MYFVHTWVHCLPIALPRVTGVRAPSPVEFIFQCCHLMSQQCHRLQEQNAMNTLAIHSYTCTYSSTQSYTYTYILYTYVYITHILYMAYCTYVMCLHSIRYIYTHRLYTKLYYVFINTTIDTMGRGAGATESPYKDISRSKIIRPVPMCPGRRGIVVHNTQMG